MPLPQTLVSRDPDTSKTDYGHALLVAGGYGKMGCAVLAAKACLHAGAGLVTVHLPQRGVDIMQTAFPEAMVSVDPSPTSFSARPGNMDRYDAFAVGPGIGTAGNTTAALLSFLRKVSSLGRPVVVDADAINILAKVRANIGTDLRFSWDEFRCPMIFTPHAREYERLFGEQDPLEVARLYHVVLVYKGHNTRVYSPDGDVYVNDTGNPGMATAGSGDVLTGIIVGLLSQHISPFEAAKVGVYLHGLAGDWAADHYGQPAMVASDIIEGLRHLFV